MPTFGFWELVLVMFVALLVVGPERLPRLAAQAGYWAGRIRRLAMNFKADLARELDTEDLQNTIAAPSREIEREIRNLDPLVKAMDDQLESERFERDHAGDDPDKRDENA